MGIPKKLDGITPKRLIYPIGCAITENGCSCYRNRMCENCLPKLIAPKVSARYLRFANVREK